jgi:hypothetical protein
MANVKKAGVSAPAVLTVNGKNYKLTDFDNGLTLEQYSEASPYAKLMIDGLTKGISQKQLDDISKGVSNFNVMQTVGSAIDVNRTIYELLAIIYINEDEEYFDPDTLDQRKKEFGRMKKTDYEIIYLHVIGCARSREQ